MGVGGRGVLNAVHACAECVRWAMATKRTSLLVKNVLHADVVAAMVAKGCRSFEDLANPRNNPRLHLSASLPSASCLGPFVGSL